MELVKEEYIILEKSESSKERRCLFSAVMEDGKIMLEIRRGSNLKPIRIDLGEVFEEDTETSGRRKDSNVAYMCKDTYEELKEREEQVQQLKVITRLDPLTGALNRTAMEEDLALEFSGSRRYKRPFSVIMADIDFFKRVNDTYGHVAGDDVLKSFCRLIRFHIREVDTVYRYGGEEFLILLRGTPLAGAHIVAERMRVNVERHVFRHRDDPKVELRITASFGVASWSESDRSYNDIIVRVDKAMYTAKNAGRNRVISERAEREDRPVPEVEKGKDRSRGRNTVSIAERDRDKDKIVPRAGKDTVIL